MKNKIIIFSTIFLATSGTQAADEKRNPITPVASQVMYPMAMDFFLRAPFSQAAVVIEPSESRAFEIAAACRNKRKFDSITESEDSSLHENSSFEPNPKRLKYEDFIATPIDELCPKAKNNFYGHTKTKDSCTWILPCCNKQKYNNNSSDQLWYKSKRHFESCKSGKEQTIDAFRKKFLEVFPEAVFLKEKGSSKKRKSETKWHYQ